MHQFLKNFNDNIVEIVTIRIVTQGTLLYASQQKFEFRAQFQELS